MNNQRIAKELAAIARELASSQWAGTMNLMKEYYRLFKTYSERDIFIEDITDGLAGLISEEIRPITADDLIRAGAIGDAQEFHEVLEELSDITDSFRVIKSERHLETVWARLERWAKQYKIRIR